MQSPEPTHDASPYLSLPLRPLPVFAAELRDRLDRLPAGAERISLARMILTAETEIVRRRRHERRYP